MRPEQMISTHADVRGNMSQPLRCIEECYDCAHVLYELCRRVSR